MVHILLNANETQRRREELLDNICLHINEELAYSEIISCNNKMVKVKVPPLQAIKALRAGRGIAVPNLRTRH